MPPYREVVALPSLRVMTLGWGYSQNRTFGADPGRHDTSCPYSSRVCTAMRPVLAWDDMIHHVPTLPICGYSQNAPASDILRNMG
ncbi:MAG: hypothetical protein K2M52_03215 [Paramuribaculum sp.]|nr:hypothetical protein [Paramuribaculum sp.]MDE7452323.1 hypothetical protein [Paramuribaculum sp.]